MTLRFLGKTLFLPHMPGPFCGVLLFLLSWASLLSLQDFTVGFFRFPNYKERMRKSMLPLHRNTSDQAKIQSPEVCTGPSEAPRLCCGCRLRADHHRSLLRACLDFPVCVPCSRLPKKPVCQHSKAPGVQQARWFPLSSLGSRLGFFLASSFYFKDRIVVRERWYLHAFGPCIVSVCLHPLLGSVSLPFASSLPLLHAVHLPGRLSLLPACPALTLNGSPRGGSSVLVLLGLTWPRPHVPCCRI